MSKNLTRKGLAFGALVALASSAITGAPASAAGLADKTFVSLLPQTGTEYTVLADQTFDLKANLAQTISGSGKLKFQVVDSTSATRALAQSKYVADLTSIAFGSVALSGSTFTVTSANSFQVGDYVTITKTGVTAGVGSDGVARVTAVASDGSTFSYSATAGSPSAPTTAGTYSVSLKVSRAAIIAASTALSEQAAIGGTTATSIAGTATTANTLRTAAGTYVVSSDVNTSSSDKVLRLVSTSTSTKAVTVTAWVDSNNDNAIDSTEYTSEERVVTFQKASEITGATTLSPIVGDIALTANITTTPVLNGQQVLAQDPTFLNAAFTRQDSASTVYAEADKGTATNQTVTWNDTTKAFSAVVNLDADASDEASVAVGTQASDAWDLVGARSASSDGTNTTAGELTGVVLAATGVVTVTVVDGHNLRNGDLVTVAVDATNDAGVAVAAETAAKVTVTSATTFTYKVSETTTITAASDVALNGTGYTVVTWADAGTPDQRAQADRVFAGSYTAQAVIKTASTPTYSSLGAKVTASTAAVATSAATLSIAGSATAQTVNAKDNTANLTKIKTGTTSVPVTLTAFDADEAAVSAGRPVIVSTQALVTNSAAAAGSFKINGLSSPQTLYTDASGKVSFTLTETAGLVSAQVRIQAVVEGTVTVGADLDWTDQAYGLVDFNTTGGQFTPASTVTVNRVVLAGGSYTLGLGVTDQWFTAGDAAAYRLKVTGSGAPEGLVALTSGKADVKITDSGITAVGGTFTTTVTLQKATAGVFADTTTVLSVVSTVIAAPSIVTGASGSTLYGNAVVLSSAVTAKALVELDSRSSAIATPAYAANAVVNGAVRNASTSVGIEGAIVTVSGASNLLFENGSVAKLGSLSFLSAASTGNFEFKVYSTTAQKDSVVTITVNGVSTTVKVTFTGVSTSVKKLTVTPNATSYIAGQAVTYTIKLTDNLGNPVDTAAVSGTAAAAYITVSYAGPGIISGSLPVETDATGEAVVRIVTGVVDTQSAVLTVKYDQNYDGDFVDTYDLTVASTVAVKAAPEIAATITGATKKIAFTIDNSKGELVQIKVAGKTVKTFTAYSNAHAFGIKAAKGSQAVKVYVAGELVAAKTVSVK